MQSPNQRPSFSRGFTSHHALDTPTEPRTPVVQSPVPRPPKSMHVKRVTLTSKKNWWMVEMDEEEDRTASQQSQYSVTSFSSSEETAVEPPPVYNTYNHGIDDGQRQIEQAHHHGHPLPHAHERHSDSPPPSPIYNPPRHPTSIFSFPTPTAYSAPPNPTASLQPFAHGSASELFRCVVKKPDVVQLEINGEMQSNAGDVTIQFLAELRVYTTLARHRNICAFLGCLENVGMVLAYIDGRTLYDVIIERPMLTTAQKVDYHNQLLDGLTHLHSYRLSHGDLSLLNVQVTKRTNTVKLLDFGRSVSADSQFKSPDDEPVDPFPFIAKKQQQQAEKLPTVKVEQIHPGTRPFSAPEILRGECQDPLLADAYSFGMIMVCIDRCESVDVKPWEQRKDKLPADLYEGCDLFGERAKEYLRRWDEGRRRLNKMDMIVETGT